MESFAKESFWLKALLMFIRGNSEEKTNYANVTVSGRHYRGNELF